MSLVLVVDDEPAVLEVLSQVVEDLGHEVVRAHDGAEALKLARAHPPQLVVTDHVMPRLSGAELCGQLARDPVLQSVPVILLSGVLEHRIPEAHAFLHKPFEISDFESTVRKALHSAGEPTGVAAPAVSVPARWVVETFGAPLEALGEALEGLSEDRLPSSDQLTRMRAQASHLRGAVDALRRGLPARKDA